MGTAIVFVLLILGMIVATAQIMDLMVLPGRMTTRHLSARTPLHTGE